MRVATVEGVPLCVPCGGQRLSAQTAAGESEWWSPSVACVDVTRRAPLGGRTLYLWFVRGARAVGVFRRRGAQPVSGVRRTRVPSDCAPSASPMLTAQRLSSLVPRGARSARGHVVTCTVILCGFWRGQSVSDPY
jgi:hypothetical protein